jgi:hypothetical protein
VTHRRPVVAQLDARRRQRSSQELLSQGAPVHRRRRGERQNGEGMTPNSPRRSVFSGRWWFGLAAMAFFSTLIQPTRVLFCGPPTAMMGGTKSPSSGGAHRPEKPTLKAAERCGGMQLKLEGGAREKQSGRCSMGPFIGVRVLVCSKQPSGAYPQRNQRSIRCSIRIFERFISR